MAGNQFVPGVVTSPYSPNPIAVTITDDLYWAAQPTPVQALRNMDESLRFDAAVALAKAGYAIDFPIMVYGWDAVTTMFIRVQDGYTWVPRADGSPILLPPGLIFPGIASYDPNNPPAGSIKVSVSASDYPPFAPVAVIPPAATKAIVGAPVGDGKTFYGGPGAMLNSLTPAVTDGEIIPQGGVNYIAHVVRELMGFSVTFTLQ